jgi:hypothetical protein
VFGPELRPGDATGPLISGDSLLVLLPERLEAHDVLCQVEGLARGEKVASGYGVARVQAGAEVECRAVLWSTRGDGGACDGCYDEHGSCRPGAADDQCGSGGAACSKCEHGGHCRSGTCAE